MKNTKNFTPKLTKSQLEFRIRLAANRLHSYPLDTIDYIMIDLEKPYDKHRHAYTYETDLTGRTLEFLSEAYSVLDNTDDTRLKELFSRIMLKEPKSGMIRRMAAYYRYSNDAEALDYIKSVCGKWLEIYDEYEGNEEKLRPIFKEILVHDSCVTGYFSCVIEPLAFLYEITGDERYMKIAKIDADALYEEIGQSHAHGHNTVLRSMQAAAIMSGDEWFAELPARHRREIIDRGLQYADGSISEAFPHSSRTEGCAIADWIIINLRHGFMFGDDDAYAVAEHSLYNGLFFNQLITGGFGHRSYNRRGYGTNIEEAWWCCTQTGGLAMIEFARHALQFMEGKIRVNFLVPGVYTLNNNGKMIKATVSTNFPEDFDAQVLIEGADDVEVEFRIPYYVKNAKTHSRTNASGGVYHTVRGDIGFYTEQREDGYSLKYGPLLLSPMTTDWQSIPVKLSENEKNVPDGYIKESNSDECLLMLGKPDKNGFYDLCAKDNLPVWTYYDDGAGSHTGTHGKGLALVNCKFKNGVKKLYFQPLCYATSNLTINNVRLVFDLDEQNA